MLAMSKQVMLQTKQSLDSVGMTLRRNMRQMGLGRKATFFVKTIISYFFFHVHVF